MRSTPHVRHAKGIRPWFHQSVDAACQPAWYRQGHSKLAVRIAPAECGQWVADIRCEPMAHACSECLTVTIPIRMRYTTLERWRFMSCAVHCLGAR